MTNIAHIINAMCGRMTPDFATHRAVVGLPCANAPALWQTHAEGATASGAVAVCTDGNDEAAIGTTADDISWPNCRARHCTSKPCSNSISETENCEQ